MILKEVIQWLLDNKYGLIVNDQFIVTQKLNQDLFNRPQDSVVAIARVIHIPETVNVSNIINKDIVSIDNKKQIWNEFIERACIPHRVKDGKGGQYTVRQYNEPAIKKLISIIKDPNINYDRLINSTKHYYMTVSYKVLLSNYLLKDMWLDEYKNYKEGSVNHEGTNRFED